MKNVTSISVEVTFPFGAHFYGNLQLIVYKKLLQFIYHLNCLSPSSTCINCPLKEQCKYYYCTGQNFKYYPGILIHADDFPKTIYQKEEVTVFQFYLLGHLGKQYVEYIRLFFTSFLEQQIAGALFYCKNIKSEPVNDDLIKKETVNLISLVEQKDFLQAYYDMISYYNQTYQCEFPLFSADSSYEVSDQKQIILTPVKFPTKKVFRKGYVYTVHFHSSIEIPKSICRLGIGKYNYIGGGAFED